LPRLPAAMSSLLLLLQPAAALVLAAVVLHEQPTFVQVTGAMLACLGVLAVTWRRTSRGRDGQAAEVAATWVGLPGGARGAEPPGVGLPGVGQARTANSL